MTTEVVIVGGGIVGCMTAMELVERGIRVTIVERNAIASQTSGESSWAGGGIIFPLLPWSYSEEVNSLTRNASQSYQKICDRLFKETGIDCGFEQSGFLLLPEFDRSKASTWCDSNQVPYEETKASYFGVDSPNGQDSLFLPSVCQVRPPFFMQALRKWLEQNKVKMIEHTQLLPIKTTGHLNSWKSVNGEMFEADKFVVTSGAWSYELLKEVANKLQIKPMRGQILLYKPDRKLINHIVYRNGFYLIPRKDGFLLAGSTLEDVGFDPSVTEEVKAELALKAEAILPELKNSPILKHWCGLRPGTPENMPTISSHPHIDNLFLNTGHFRYGLTMAPASAKLICDLMTHQVPLINPESFTLKE